MVYQVELWLSFSKQLAEELRGGGHQLTDLYVSVGVIVFVCVCDLFSLPLKLSLGIAWLCNYKESWQNIFNHLRMFTPVIILDGNFKVPGSTHFSVNE